MAQAPVVYSAKDLRRRLDALPRFHLTDLPTPLLELPNLTRQLGGPRLLMKRDDLTQGGLGGNKNRKFQFEVGEALAQDCDVLLWGGGVMQSNHARQCAAAARRAGMDVVLVLNEGPHGKELQGNRLLLDLLGADVRPTGRDGMFGHEADLAATANELWTAGRRPYVIDYGPLTSIGYVECVLEIHEQSHAMGADVTHLYVASGGGTQAGLELGNRALGAGYAIRGFSPLIVEGGRTAQQAEMANATAERLGLNVSVRSEDICNSQAFVGPAYAEATPEGVEAIRLVAETEGIFLEPVYTGKAFAALLDDIRSGHLTAQDTVVFLHTGGTPLIFAYADELGESARLNG
ncbi:MAG: pyridoxal-phosphate dependent enzyme [Chloroflexota bacterium]|nr:pyridoxal-phosphate dependent enzyme [Chloroflexota bacterium]